MSKISFDYINAAEQMTKKGDYVSALHYYFLQRNNERTNEIDLCIANTYVAMGLLHEAIKYFFNVHSNDPKNVEALGGLVLCYREIDDEAACYYLSEIINNDKDFSEIDEELFSEIDEELPTLTVHDKRDKSETMDRAYELLDSGDIKGAVSVLETIDKDSFQYCDALLMQASLALDEGKIDKALELADTVLSFNSAHLPAYVLKVMAYDILGDKDNIDKCVEKIDSFDFRDEENVTKVALCLSNLGYYGLAEKYLLRKLEFSPYDKMILMCLCSVYAAKGDKQSAFKTSGKVCTIYPDEIEVKEITSRILNNGAVRVPNEIFNLKREWCELIKKLFVENFKTISEPENIRIVKWLLQSNNNLYLQSATAIFIAGLPEFDSLIDEFLMDPFAPTIVKKQILMRRIPERKIKTVRLVVSNIYRCLKVRHPRLDAALKFAYYYVFIACAVSEFEFENKLNSALRKLAAKYEQLGDDDKKEISVDALAAILSVMTIGGNIETNCSSFDCEEEEYLKAAKLLNIMENK